MEERDEPLTELIQGGALTPGNARAMLTEHLCQWDNKKKSPCKPAEEPVVGELAGDVEVGRCRLTLSNPC